MRHGIKVAVQDGTISAAAVVFLLSSSAVHANPIRQSICPLDEYFDGIDKKCVKCSLICRPELPQDFCQNNCRGYLSSTKTTSRDEAPRVQPVLMPMTQSSTYAERHQQSIVPQRNDVTTSATSSSTFEVVIIAVVSVSAVCILAVVVIVIVVVVILHRLRATSQETKTTATKNPSIDNSDDSVDEKNNKKNFERLPSQSSTSSESTTGSCDSSEEMCTRPFWSRRDETEASEIAVEARPRPRGGVILSRDGVEVEASKPRPHSWSVVQKTQRLLTRIRSCRDSRDGTDQQ